MIVSDPFAGDLTVRDRASAASAGASTSASVRASSPARLFNQLVCCAHVCGLVALYATRL